MVGALGGMGGASAFGPKADIQVLKLTKDPVIGFVPPTGLWSSLRCSRPGVLCRLSGPALGD